MSNEKMGFWSDDFVAGIYEGYWLALLHNYDGCYADGDDEKMHLSALARTEQHVAENYPDHRFNMIQLRIDFGKIRNLKQKAKTRRMSKNSLGIPVATPSAVT